ncbi:Myb domain protein 6 [Hibiscus syriacus]|uniref:Myb domain protein 6 n=1 Tax=Hibiscus syriacus TaxID=106335 RepID=A0A6A3ATP9_HIBSY|nr:Myb domain protein 6 [Hibiscus syriacus]
MGNSIGGRKKAKEAVKHYGIRAKPLEPQQDLKPKKIYFLVELPKFPQEDKAPRRVRSGGIHMSAKDRLECLMLSRRTVSDVSMVRASSSLGADGIGVAPAGSGGLTVKMRLTKSQMAKLVEESRDGVEVADKILDLYIDKLGGGADNQIHR